MWEDRRVLNLSIGRQRQRGRRDRHLAGRCHASAARATPTTRLTRDVRPRVARVVRDVVQTAPASIGMDLSDVQFINPMWGQPKTEKVRRRGTDSRIIPKASRHTTLEMNCADRAQSYCVVHHSALRHVDPNVQEFLGILAKLVEAGKLPPKLQAGWIDFYNNSAHLSLRTQVSIVLLYTSPIPRD